MKLCYIPLTELLTTNFPTYCNIGPTTAVYLYYLRVRTISGPSAAARTGYGGGPALRPQVYIAAVKPRASRLDV